MENQPSGQMVPYGKHSRWAAPSAMVTSLLGMLGSLQAGGGDFLGTIVAVVLNPILWLAVWLFCKSRRLICPHCGTRVSRSVGKQASPKGEIPRCRTCENRSRTPPLTGRSAFDTIVPSFSDTPMRSSAPSGTGCNEPTNSDQTNPFVLLGPASDKSTDTQFQTEVMQIDHKYVTVPHSPASKLAASEWNPKNDPVVYRTDGTSTFLTLKEHNRRAWKEASKTDLSNLDLRGYSFEGAKLAGAKLDGANFEGCNLKSADLNDVSAKCCCFENVDFSGASLHRANFHESNLRFSKFHVSGRSGLSEMINNTIFERCDLSNSDFAATHLDAPEFVSHSPDGIRSDFAFCNLSNSVFQAVDFRGSRFASANLFGACLIRCNFEGVSLLDTNIVNTKFSEIRYSDSSKFPQGFVQSNEAINTDRRRELEAKAKQTFEIWFVLATIALVSIAGLLCIIPTADAQKRSFNDSPERIAAAPGKTSDRGHDSKDGSDTFSQTLAPEDLGPAPEEDSVGKTTFMNITGIGRSFAYLIDMSDSITGAQFRAARTELTASLQQLNPEQQISLIKYGRVEFERWPGLYSFFGTEINKKIALKDFDIPDSGNIGQSLKHVCRYPDSYSALQAALSLRPDIIYFVTGGSGRGLGPEQLRTLDLMNHGAVIHVIEFPGTSGLRRYVDWERKLAIQGMGEYRVIDRRWKPEGKGSASN